jgi:hypothetical protein
MVTVFQVAAPQAASLPDSASASERRPFRLNFGPGLGSGLTQTVAAGLGGTVFSPVTVRDGSETVTVT